MRYLAQEEQVDEEGAGYHSCGPKQKHQHKVCRLSPKAERKYQR